MKKKLNLFKLSKREGRKVTGGSIPGDCKCGCAYVNCGGSSSRDNYIANGSEGLKSPNMKPVC